MKTTSNRFRGSNEYWEGRYLTKGNSGPGSYGKLAEFKAEVINAFVAKHEVESVIEFGCGDGNQLSLAKYPTYLGFDVSQTAISRCRKLFSNDKDKVFAMMHAYANQRADLALSLDVIFHLVEDDVFEDYTRTLFAAASRYVIIYSSDTDDNRGYEGSHVRHREFSAHVRQSQRNWNLTKRLPNKFPYKGDDDTGSFAEFFVYERIT